MRGLSTPQWVRRAPPVSAAIGNFVRYDRIISVRLAVLSFQARSSVWLERYLDTVEVNGSSPFGPTTSITYEL